MGGKGREGGRGGFRDRDKNKVMGVEGRLMGGGVGRGEGGGGGVGEGVLKE